MSVIANYVKAQTLDQELCTLLSKGAIKAEATLSLCPILDLTGLNQYLKIVPFPAIDRQTDVSHLGGALRVAAAAPSAEGGQQLLPGCQVAQASQNIGKMAVSSCRYSVERQDICSGVSPMMIVCRSEAMMGASSTGWGTVWKRRVVQDRWVQRDRSKHVNGLGLRAVHGRCANSTKQHFNHKDDTKSDQFLKVSRDFLE